MSSNDLGKLLIKELESESAEGLKKVTKLINFFEDMATLKEEDNKGGQLNNGIDFTRFSIGYAKISPKIQEFKEKQKLKQVAKQEEINHQEENERIFIAQELQRSIRNI